MICFLSGSAFAANLKGASYPYPPFNDQNLPNGGLMVDIVTQTFKEAGHQLDVNSRPWARVIDDLKSGKADVVIGIWWKKERENFLYFTKPVLFNELKFVKRKDNKADYDGTIKSLDGLKIGTARGYTYGEAFDNAKNFKKEPTPDVKASIIKVTMGRIDMAVEDQIVAQYLINTTPKVADKRAELTFVKKPLNTVELFVAVSKQNPDHEKIAKDFNDALARLKASGKLYDIAKQHGQDLDYLKP
jgi:polar amino acid transport system substrate-binding protein